MDFQRKDDMKYIMERDGDSMKWTRPRAMNRYHELRSNGALYASLKWEKMYGSLATGESRAVKFTFKRAGFLRPYVTVRKEGSVADSATLRFSSGSVIVNAVFGPSGILRFESGEEYLFTKPNFWISRWEFTDLDGNPLVSFDKKRGRKPAGIVTIHSDIRPRLRMDLMLLLGWYVIVLDHEESEAHFSWE